MPWEYAQATGELRRDGKKVATGYSGRGVGRNSPGMEKTANVGPIPRGKYTISAPFRSLKTGPVVMNLTPVGHLAHGRSAFQIHGNNRDNDASHGCIILGRPVREQIAKSKDNTLIVVSEFDEDDNIDESESED